jgi:DNA-binding NarL/FixJ family response regulator
VIDILLPGRLSGVEMVKEVRRRNPNLRVVFTSGKPLPDAMRGIGPFLSKPVRLGDLIAMLRTVISAGGPHSSTSPTASPR